MPPAGDDADDHPLVLPANAKGDADHAPAGCPAPALSLTTLRLPAVVRPPSRRQSSHPFRPAARRRVRRTRAGCPRDNHPPTNAPHHLLLSPSVRWALRAASISFGFRLLIAATLARGGWLDPLRAHRDLHPARSTKLAWRTNVLGKLHRFLASTLTQVLDLIFTYLYLVFFRILDMRHLTALLISKLLPSTPDLFFVAYK